jgi:hypothetical protein
MANAKYSFPRRHEEAKELIESVYAHYVKYGSWPRHAEIDAAQQSLRTAGWHYEADSGDGLPSVFIHGPYHMILSYYFEPPASGRVSDEWAWSIEGDKRYFKAQVPYQLKDGAEDK